MTALIESANGHRHEPPAREKITLRDLAIRLTPNPALTVDGTLQIILSGIDNLDNEDLARALAQANMSRSMGGEVEPLSDEQWAAGDIQSKLRLIEAAASLKMALRMMI